MKKNEFMNSQINDTLMELLAKSVSDKSDPKLLDVMKDKMNMNELLLKCIMNKNLDSSKLIIENYGFNGNQYILINPLFIKNDENYSKENFNQVEVPLVILAAIAGFEELFDYLIFKKHDLKQPGHIALSPKKKNSVISNCLGAACHYGNSIMVGFLLKKIKETGIAINSMINFKSQEKKVLLKKLQISKEMSGLTPIMFAVRNEVSYLNGLKIFNMLKEMSNIQDLDSEGNSLLHLATKARNENLVKTLVEGEFDFKAQNSNGDSSYLIAQNNNYSEISSFFASLERNEVKLQENLFSIINEDFSTTKKNKKKGKNKNSTNVNEFSLSNFTEKKPIVNPVSTVKQEQQPIKKTEDEDQNDFTYLDDEMVVEVNEKEEKNDENKANLNSNYKGMKSSIYDKYTDSSYDNYQGGNKKDSYTKAGHYKYGKYNEKYHDDYHPTTYQENYYNYKDKEPIYYSNEYETYNDYNISSNYKGNYSINGGYYQKGRYNKSGYNKKSYQQTSYNYEKVYPKVPKTIEVEIVEPNSKVANENFKEEVIIIQENKNHQETITQDVNEQDFFQPEINNKFEEKEKEKEENEDSIDKLLENEPLNKKPVEIVEDAASNSNNLENLIVYFFK